MHVLLIHRHPGEVAGAERLLGYFLRSAVAEPVQFTLALATAKPWHSELPNRFSRIFTAKSDRFSVLGLLGQCVALLRQHRRHPVDLVHAWAARDWELGAMVGRLMHRPVVATLHDHPLARFISPKRRRLMRWTATFGSGPIVCVSEAVRQACVDAGYPMRRLIVIRNGIPKATAPGQATASSTLRMGYLGVFSERKGLRDLFALLARLAETMSKGWTLALAGEAQNEEGQNLVRSLHQQYGTAPWWSQVVWRGWVDKPVVFAAECDLLICPSSEFEPFGLVLCEAAMAGVPALAARIGGIIEIVQHEITGWLYEPGDIETATQLILQLARDPTRVRRAGEAARHRVCDLFSAERMTQDYLRLYDQLAHRRNRSGQ
jgi:glycosyltransferase involved in cell wall biosynthesis